MSLKNIGVFVDATAEGERRLDYAAALAHQCCAYLTGIHVVTADRLGHRFDHYVVGKKAIRDSLAWEKAADEAAIITARRRFEAISTKYDLRGEYRVLSGVASNEELLLASLHSDLVIIGQRELHELPGYGSPERLLLASATPILVIPSGWKSESISKRILIGWNASREARRAVADALPILVQAASVTLLIVDSNERAGRHGERPGVDIALHAARHGVRVEVEQVSSEDSPVADVILSYAADHDVDLIVIGAYSRARIIEMVFGGVTRTLLKESHTPILMSR